MTLAELKTALVKAHRAGDWEQAKHLSQMREKLKRQRAGACKICGVAISREAIHCLLHDPWTRRRKKANRVS